MNGSAPPAGACATLTIAWRGDGPHYTVDGREVGCGRAGFDAVLALIRAHPAARITIALPGYGLGGQDLIETTPFAERANELMEALSGRTLDWRAGG